MLKLKYLTENYDLARLALSHWAHDASALDRTLPRFRISSNAVYPFLQEGKLCFLRLSPVEEKQPGNVQAEMAFIRHLRRAGYPAHEPLPSLDGPDLLTLATPWGDHYASAFAGAGGKPVEDQSITPELLLDYGHALGRLHSLSAAYEGPQPWSHQTALAWTERTLLDCAAPQAVLTALHRLQDDLSQLPQTPAGYGLVHYDFEPDNVFYAPESRACTVIDFDDCMLHWYALDICQALTALEELVPPDTFGQTRSLLLRGYAQVRPLPDDLDTLLPLMQRFIDLYGYARTLRCIHHPPEVQPPWMQNLVKKLQISLHNRLMRLI